MYFYLEKKMKEKEGKDNFSYSEHDTDIDFGSCLHFYAAPVRQLPLISSGIPSLDAAASLSLSEEEMRSRMILCQRMWKRWGTSLNHESPNAIYMQNLLILVTSFKECLMSHTVIYI